MTLSLGVIGVLHEVLLIRKKGGAEEGERGIPSGEFPSVLGEWITPDTMDALGLPRLRVEGEGCRREGSPFPSDRQPRGVR